nr:hypothetical protein [Tanacetum cinerariifolium]
MAPVHLGTGPAPNLLIPGQISSGLSRAERPVPPAQVVQAPVNSAGTPSSTTRGDHQSKTGPDRLRPDRTETDLV